MSVRDANTLQATAQQLAVGLGVPAGTVALRAGRPLGALLPVAAGLGSAYTIAFLLLAMASLLATAGALRSHPDAGSAASRGRAREPVPARGAPD